MHLNEAFVTPVVDKWSDSLSVAWTSVEKKKVAHLLTDISAHVTPHIIMDAQFTDDQAQSYLLAKAIERLEDWLSRAVSRYRKLFGVDNPSNNAPLLGLRSATLAEIVDLPGIEDKLAIAIARYVALNDNLTDLDALTAIDGIGPARLNQLKANAYLDYPTLGLMSGSLWQFMMFPSVQSFLKILENTDMFLFFGTQNTIDKRLALVVGGFERFIAFLELVHDQAARVALTVGGTLASDAIEWLDRHAMRNHLLSTAQPTDGGILINTDYVQHAKQVIDNAQNSINLMVFLGTAAEGKDEAPGPATLVAAMELAVTRNVDVRVILDQDDGGEPYKSFFINRPLVERFKANGVKVKFDEKDTLLHSKLLVVDESIVITGSHNWTRTGFNSTHELSVVIDNKTVASDFGSRFNSLWDQLPDI